VRRFGMKFHRFISIAMIVTFTYISFLYCPAGAVEPQRPDVNKIFSEEKEAKIQALISLGTEEVFERLMSSDFRINRDLTYKAIYIAYTDRRAEALSLAQVYLMLPLIEIDDGQRVTHVGEFNVAKKIFHVFPDEATPILVNLYSRSDEITRGNIIRASGGVAGGPPIKNMLVKALDDKSFAEDEETPDLMGEPLRVCDLAYNQIVFRYGISNVLRTISSAHKIETRDYHINILKNLL
jgi:hypothetical protein